MIPRRLGSVVAVKIVLAAGRHELGHVTSSMAMSTSSPNTRVIRQVMRCWLRSAVVADPMTRRGRDETAQLLETIGLDFVHSGEIGQRLQHVYSA